MKKNNGFTLIELMIVVAIVGILAAIAIPAYQSYTARAQVSEGITLASNAKVSITDYYTNTGFLPLDNTTAGYGGASGKYVSEVRIENGAIVSVFGANANANLQGKTITLAPVEDYKNTNLAWNCTSTIIEKIYLPATCR